jgi:HD superfamily phosphohydrolase
MPRQSKATKATGSARQRAGADGDRKEKRVRDPIHDLIVFDDANETDRLIWRLLNCREFQRLRRIRQLGFSEFVFPGATHTRLSHCIGVFHTAREILSVLKKLVGTVDHRRVCISLCAALLHDLGHGPFSHVFEGVCRDLGRKKKHEAWTSEIILGDTDIHRVLHRHDSDLPAEIAKLITSEDPVDIYSSIVSSQFDADRLDYLRRDKYMCGVAVGAFDYSWILKNLVLSNVYMAVDKGQGIGHKIDWLVLDPKAREAAEGYLLARYQLYSTIYYHKTTRSAEKILSLLLKEIVNCASDGRRSDVQELLDNSVVRFLRKADADVHAYLAMDDYSIWALVSEAASCKVPIVSELSRRLLERQLFKAFDLSNRTEAANSAAIDFVYELKHDAQDLGLEWGKTLIEDAPRQRGYDWYEWDTQSSLKKVLVKDKERNTNIDIGASPLVKALHEKKFLRLYVPDEAALLKLEKRWKEGGQS